MKKPGMACLLGLLLVSGGCAHDTLIATAAPTPTVIREPRGHLGPAPLIVLDGRVSGRGPTLPDTIVLDPKDVWSVEVMKGPGAVEAWGPDAVDGVILVTTRHARAVR